MVHTVWYRNDPQFPQSLNEAPTPPKQLYVIGDADTLNAPRVAIVGTRRPSPYGERITRHLASTLAQAGACIVSGMALGIDSIAHRAALDVNGKTIAVLGMGIDEVYPSSNRLLYSQIAERGLVISEFGPGTKMFRGCFPRRNRIVAGLCALTIVVEAAPKSGASITAQYALDAHRLVAAVPGPIDALTSYTPNHLIRDGAHIIATVDDALSLLGLPPTAAKQSQKNTIKGVIPDPEHQLAFLVRQTQSTTAPSAPKAPADLSPDEAQVFAETVVPGLTSDTLIHRLQIPIPRCLAALSTLEIRGLIKIQLTGEITRV